VRNLYEELGVDRGADAEEIKAAYRRRARETHPDLGGKREDFQRVQAAYEVLSDEKKRAFYDTTGSAGTDPGSVPSAVELLVQFFGEVLAVKEPIGGFFGEAENPLRQTRKAMEGMMGSIREDVVKLTREETRLKKVLARLERKGGDALLEGLIEAKIAPVTAEIARGKLFVVRLTEAVGLLDGYRFKSDASSAAELVFESMVAAGPRQAGKRRPRK